MIRKRMSRKKRTCKIKVSIWTEIDIIETLKQYDNVELEYYYSDSFDDESKLTPKEVSILDKREKDIERIRKYWKEVNSHPIPLEQKIKNVFSFFKIEPYK